MQESDNHFAYWQAMSAEQPERLVNLFVNRFERLSPVNQRAFIVSLPHRDDLVERIRLVQNEPERPLAAVPYVLQDLFDVDGLPTQCGAPFKGPFDEILNESSLLHKTLEAMGAVLMAKTVPSEFGVDLRGINPSFGDCPHADNDAWICGGGAGSCAHAVKKGWVPLAFGLDGAGGIRIPAAFHGLFGFRMNEKAFAREGIVPGIPSLETVGWMTQTLDDLGRTFAAFYPQTRLDIEDRDPRGFLLREPGIPIDTEIKAGLMAFLHCLDLEAQPEMNHKLCCEFENARESLKTIQSRELYALHKYWVDEYGDHYDADLLDRIDAGRDCPPKKADRAVAIQQNIREAFALFFQDFDYLVSPISPRPTSDKKAWSNRLEDDLVHLNAPASLALLPSLILPFPCKDGRHSAAQFIIHPAKLRLVPKILKNIQPFYQ